MNFHLNLENNHNILLGNSLSVTEIVKIKEIIFIISQAYDLLLQKPIN